MARAYLWSRFWKEKQKIQKGPNQRTLIYSKWPQLLKISLKTYIFIYMKIKRGLQTIIIIVCTGYDDVTFMAFLYKKQPYKSKKKKDQICYIIKGTLWKLFFTTEKQGRYSHDKILNYLQIFWVVMSKFQLLSQSWNSGISKLQFWNTKKFWLMHSSYYCCCCCYYNYIVLIFFSGGSKVQQHLDSTIFQILPSTIVSWCYDLLPLLHGLSLPPHLRDGGQGPMLECYSLYLHCTPPTYSTNNRDNNVHIDLFSKPQSTSNDITAGRKPVSTSITGTKSKVMNTLKTVHIQQVMSQGTV